MRNCTVIFNSGRYFSTFELYLESSNCFLLSCIINNEEFANDQTFFFVQCPDVHKLDISSFRLKHKIASMTGDWISGLNFKLKRRNGIIATIRFDAEILKIYMTIFPSFSSALNHPFSETNLFPSEFDCCLRRKTREQILLLMTISFQP